MPITKLSFFIPFFRTTKPCDTYIILKGTRNFLWSLEARRFFVPRFLIWFLCFITFQIVPTYFLRDFTMPDRLMNENRISIFERNMDSYLKMKPRDCVLYSEDGAKFKAHKVLKYNFWFHGYLQKNCQLTQNSKICNSGNRKET